jgi:hypothetical protein
MIYGSAELVEGEDPRIEEMRWRIIRHYYESEAAARAYLASIGEIETSLIIVTPHKVISQDFN